MLDITARFAITGAHHHEYKSSITKETTVSPQGILITRNGAF